jgi:enolase
MPKEYVMPVPFFNVLNGGVHSGNTMAFQEFMIAPVGASSFADAVRMGAEVYSELKTVITEKFGKSGMSTHFTYYRRPEHCISGRILT